MSLEFHNRDVHINAIRVPWDTLPCASKIAKCYGFYLQHGYLDRVIVIDGQYWLRDGLAGLMVARAVGLKRVKVLQVTEKKDKPEIKPETKTEIKSEAKPEPQAETKVETKPVTLPDFRIPKEVEDGFHLRVLCVKSNQGLVLSHTRGKVYEFAGRMLYNENLSHFLSSKPAISFGAWRRENPISASCVVPLVSRPAKVGEWVRVKESASTGKGVDGGDICRVVMDGGVLTSAPGYVYVRAKRDVFPKRHVYLSPYEYEVLEGYDGRFEPVVEEPEPQPETTKRVEAKTLCDCYHERDSGPHGVISECWGTREREECSCHGYRELCTFYPEHRKSPTTETGGSHETEV